MRVSIGSSTIRSTAKPPRPSRSTTSSVVRWRPAQAMNRCTSQSTDIGDGSLAEMVRSITTTRPSPAIASWQLPSNLRLAASSRSPMIRDSR